MAPARISTTGVVVAAAAALALLAPTAALAADGGDAPKPKPKRHLKPLTGKEMKRAAIREARATLEGAGEVDGVRCKRRGKHLAICTAYGTYESAEESGVDFELEGEEGTEEEASELTWSAKIEVRAKRARHGKRVVRADVEAWSENGEECDPFAMEGSEGDEGEDELAPCTGFGDASDDEDAMDGEGDGGEGGDGGDYGEPEGGRPLHGEGPMD